MDVGRPKKNDYPLYMTRDGDRGAFMVRNPLTGKKKRFVDEAIARQAAELLAQWVEQERKLKALDSGRPTIANLVTTWIRDRLRFMPWDVATRAKMIQRMNRISRELGDRTVARTDRMFLEEWLDSFCKNGDHFNKWRYALVLLWEFAVSRKLAEACEPELVQPRSTSKKIAMNRKVRRQLDVAAFKAIHAAAPAYLQIAMELSIVTLQARSECCNMQHADFRNGHLFVIRDKVSGDSDMAFIKIALTAELLDLQARSRLTVETPKRAKRDVTAVVSPYLVHRQPEHRRREWTAGKPHWTYVNPEYLSKAFAAARDSIEAFTKIPERERPTFHEIRGLGARLYRAAGVAEEAIQALMTHSNKRTTQIYLERGRAALTDDDYYAVTATMRVRDVIGEPP